MLTEDKLVSSHTAPRSRRPLLVATPELQTYRRSTGIGRVLHSLCDEWGTRVQLIDVGFATIPLPITRNFPYGLRYTIQPDLILLPRLTGAQALRHTCGIPRIVIVHDIGIVDHPGDRQTMDFLTCHSIRASFHGLRYADRIIAVSHFTSDRIRAHQPELDGKIRVIPNGVARSFLDDTPDRTLARERVRRYMQQPLNGPIVLNVGSELPRKNLGLLIEALRLLKNDHPQLCLIKVGASGGPKWRQATIDTIRRNGLSPERDVLLVDSVGDDMLNSFYAAADVFVSTSLYEGFGLPALEALAVGTPVVVSNCGALPEVVGDAGLIVAPVAPAVARAIARVITEPGDHTTAVRRARAAEFNWARAAEEYLATMWQVKAVFDEHE
ncbi:MAG: glycosyltransferase family 4 protein [Chloroflexales bacterium]|nr:glycosyltransferase family 4 protein [Chloroflexales bacterium]